MPLIIYGKYLNTVPDHLDELWKAHHKLKKASEDLRDDPCQDMDLPGLLYVIPNQYAGTSPEDETISFLGADSAKTSQIVVLRETVSGATCIGHFDSVLISKGVRGMLETIQEIAGTVWGRIEMTIAGGYEDPDGESLKISRKLLTEFNTVRSNIHLMCAVIGAMNTEKNNPVIMGLAVKMKLNKIVPARFTYRGPAYRLRYHQRTCTRGVFFPRLYDFKIKRVVIDSFDYSYMKMEDVKKKVNSYDEEIRQKYSESPNEKDKNFAMTIQNLKYTPNVHSTPVEEDFQDGSPRYYKLSENGKWMFDGFNPPRNI